MNLPGFLGGDRTSIDLPAPEEALVEAMVGTGKPTVVVLMNGSALAVNWINDHANAVLEALYPGEEGGAAVAETLSGKNNPAGRLPVTFYKDVSQLPHFESYSMEGRTYRYFKGKPLYPFGYGLSYTKFSYSSLTLPQTTINAGDPLVAEATVTNTGDREGDEVAQVYLTFPERTRRSAARSARLQAHSPQARRIAAGRVPAKRPRPDDGHHRRRSYHLPGQVHHLDRRGAARHGRSGSEHHVPGQYNKTVTGVGHNLGRRSRYIDCTETGRERPKKRERWPFHTQGNFADLKYPAWDEP